MGKQRFFRREGIKVRSVYEKIYILCRVAEPEPELEPEPAGAGRSRNFWPEPELEPVY
jgi:hypothetical protein